MEVMLKRNVQKLGLAGEIVKVADGYARNYLFPQGLAGLATAESKGQFEAQERAEVKRRDVEIQSLADMAQSIEGTSCTVMAQANPEGHLFGSVTAEMIAKAFADDGIELRSTMVMLDEPFKETGVFPVQVQLTPDLTATTRVWIIGT